MTADAREVARARVEEFAEHLVDAAVNLELHSPQSSHMRDNLRALASSLRAARDAGVPMPLELDLVYGDLRHQGEILTSPSLHAGRLLRRCLKMRIGGLSFDAEVGDDELQRLFKLFLLEEIAPSPSPEALAKVLVRQGIHHVRLIPRHPTDRNRDREADALHRYQDLIGALQDNHVLAYHGRALQIEQASDIVARTIEALHSDSANLFSLASQDNMDRFTVGHSVRVALLALQVARAAGADVGHLVVVGTAALLHDIGKSKVPQEILFKHGHLDDEEWDWMAQHPRLGAEILLEQRELDPTVVGAAFCHHMAPDGLGYPTPSVEFEPSGVSKLVRVCDVFEALTSVRPYKHALTPVEAYAVMYRQERTFDPAWLQFFVRTLGLFPEGTQLAMEDGSRALVTAPGPRLDRPRVKLLAGPGGAPLTTDEPDTGTVGEELEGRRLDIAAIVTPRATVPLDEIEPVRVHTDGGPDVCCGHTRAPQGES